MFFVLTIPLWCNNYFHGERIIVNPGVETWIEMRIGADINIDFDIMAKNKRVDSNTDFDIVQTIKS